MEYITSTLGNLVDQTAFMNLTVGNFIMIGVACVFLYLAIRHEFEPLLLVPIAFGMLLVNIFPDIMISIEESENGVGGLLHYFYLFFDHMCKYRQFGERIDLENFAQLHDFRR